MSHDLYWVPLFLETIMVHGVGAGRSLGFFTWGGGGGGGWGSGGIHECMHDSLAELGPNLTPESIVYFLPKHVHHNYSPHCKTTRWLSVCNGVIISGCPLETESQQVVL